MGDTEFLGDITGLLRRDSNDTYDTYDPQEAYEIIRVNLLERI